MISRVLEYFYKPLKGKFFGNVFLKKGKSDLYLNVDAYSSQELFFYSYKVLASTTPK